MWKNDKSSPASINNIYLKVPLKVLSFGLHFYIIELFIFILVFF